VIAEHARRCIGCEDMVVVETRDAVLIAPKARTQESNASSAALKAAVAAKPICIARYIGPGAGTTASTRRALSGQRSCWSAPPCRCKCTTTVREHW